MASLLILGEQPPTKPNLHIAMTHILAIETSSKICSVALMAGDILYQETSLAERQHTQQILSQINDLLHKSETTLSQLDAIAFAAGPGSFTGIRLAASVVQGLAYGANVPIITVSSLQTLAQGAYADFAATNVAIAINAYGGYFYWGLYQLDANGIMCAVQSEQRLTPEAIPLTDMSDWFAVGDAWHIYADVLTQRCVNINMLYTNRYGYAKDVIMLAQADFANKKPAQQALPVYLYGAHHWRKTTLATKII